MSTDTRQEPLDTINAEITDAFEDLGGPSISETAQRRDHYMRQGQLDQIVDARESDIRFMNLVLSVCALPRRSMGAPTPVVATGDPQGALARTLRAGRKRAEQTRNKGRLQIPRQRDPRAQEAEERVAGAALQTPARDSREGRLSGAAAKLGPGSRQPTIVIRRGG